MNAKQKYPIEIVQTRPEYAEALAAMQPLIFPMLGEDELLSAAKYRRHLEVFPEGQFTALAIVNGRGVPIGSTSTFLTHVDFTDFDHRYSEIIDNGWLTHHDSTGEWLYGADVSVHPDFRGMGIGQRLYDARKHLIERLNLRGSIAGAMLPGYSRYKNIISVEEYILRVVEGSIFDPTLSVQLKSGFIVYGVLSDYLSDPHTGDKSAFIVRENPHYSAARAMRSRERAAASVR